MIFNTAANWCSPAGQQARLSILIFHRVLSEPDELFPGELHASRFDEVLSWLGQWFNVLPLDEATSRLQSGTLPRRAASITFDDGYRDNVTVALPILQRRGLSATFFVATSFLDGGRMWNDSVIESIRLTSLRSLNLGAVGWGAHSLETVKARRLAIDTLLGHIKYLEPSDRIEAVEKVREACDSKLPNDLMMTSDQVVALRNAGMQVGAHTCTHPILSRLSDEQAWREVVDSKARLETLLQEPVTLFAYPNGKPTQDYFAKHAELVRQAGFTAAFSTAPGVSHNQSDLFQLPRFTPWDRSRWRFGLRMLTNMRQLSCVTA